ncbi:MAG: hypothetical protein ABIN01_13785, partial [Ferruginibacter sp.]
PPRSDGDLGAGNLRPHLNGNITVKGMPAPEDKTGGELILNGLLIEGRLSVLKGNLGSLSIAHCTLLPGRGGLVAASDNPPSGTTSNQWLKIKLLRSVTGPVNLNTAMIDSLEIQDCVIDNKSSIAIDGVYVPATISASTIVGATHVKTLNASNCIFMEDVKVERRQTGCVRFCYVPGLNPQIPRRYRCQPELEITERIAEAEKAGFVSSAKKIKIRNKILASLVPGFTSLDNRHYAYAQLNRNCPVQITTGAEDGSEMGVFSFLKQPQRAANLRIALEEYLPLGLEAGIFYIT